MVSKYSRQRSAALFEDKDKSNPFNLMQSLRGTDNVYTQHRPFLSRDLLPDLLRGKTRTGERRQGPIL
jgi:hypothetical protein